MTKITELIENLNIPESTSIGFNSNKTIKENPNMILLTYVDLNKPFDMKVLKYSDAIILKNFDKDNSLDSIKKSKMIIGLELYDNSNTDLKFLENNEFDFIVYASDNVNAELLLSENLSSAYFISSLISDDKGACIEEVGFDFLFIKNDSIAFPLKISDLLKIQEMVLKNSGTIFMYSNSLPSFSDLELLRKTNVSGFAVDGNGISLYQIKSLKNQIQKLKPLKSNDTSSNTPFLPNFSENQDLDDYDE